MINRRSFLKNVPLFSAQLMSLLSCNARDMNLHPKTKRIILRSSWQTVNIGDIGHTPGILHLIEEYLPNVEVRLWASDVSNGVREMLLKRFPNLVIFTSSDNSMLKKSFKECDFLLHGSGPSLVAETDIIRWVDEVGKPYGVYGITLNNSTETVIKILSNADFVFFRDSYSLEYAKKNGVNCRIMEFAPDGAFATDTFNDYLAKSFLMLNNLEEKKFMCVIPRYRNTPYWLIPSKNRPFDAKTDAFNQKMKEHDHKALRDAIIAVIEQTDFKILIVSEDETQIALGKEMLYDPLPEAIKKRVVWRNRFWLTDEALSTYKLSAGLFGNEQHSPILCIGHGIPAIVCRFNQQTSKGLMWRDIGLKDWLFNLDIESEISGIVPAVLDIAKKPILARAKAQAARCFVKKRQRETIIELNK